MDWFFAYFRWPAKVWRRVVYTRLPSATAGLSKGRLQRDPLQFPEVTSKGVEGTHIDTRGLPEGRLHEQDDFKLTKGPSPFNFQVGPQTICFQKVDIFAKKLFCQFLGPLGFLEVKGPQSSTPQSGTPPQLEVGIQKGNQNCLLIDSICPVNENIFLLIYTVFEVASSKFGSKWIWFQIYWKALQK